MGYKSLFRLYREQPNKECFAQYWTPEGQTWDCIYQDLSGMAKSEPWDFINQEFKKEGRNYPILVNYLNYTFLRALEQGKVCYSSDPDYACFNTGLQTQNEKDIFALFYKTKNATENDKPDWSFYKFVDSYSSDLKPYGKTPEIPTYITDSTDLVFDVKYDIEINTAHIIDNNSERLPEVLRENRTLAITALNGQKDLVREKIKRNYKVAIPHWYNGKIQLLLPLCLTNENKADLALVADKDASMKIYRISTILTMDMAYIDARLICRPDRDWLNP